MVDRILTAVFLQKFEISGNLNEYFICINYTMTSEILTKRIM